MTKHLFNGQNQEMELFSKTNFLPDLEIFSGIEGAYVYTACQNFKTQLDDIYFVGCNSNFQLITVIQIPLSSFRG